MDFRHICGFPISYFFIFLMLGMEPRVLCMLHNIPNPCFILTQSLVKLLSFKTQFKFPFNLEVCFLFPSSLSFPPSQIQLPVLWAIPWLFPLSKAHLKLCFVLSFLGLDYKDPLLLIPGTLIIINKAAHTLGS